MIISTKKLKHKIFNRDEHENIIDEKLILKNIDIDIEQGQFIAVLGHNGSGKSTFARHLNALLIPDEDEGSVYINGMDTKDVDKIWKIRQTCGMVFQNPDNQIVGVTVEEDVGFGPENLGVKTSEIWQRVNFALESVEMTDYAKNSPNKLSGGQKQRVAIASSLAMKPKCIVLDEPTAMLDPQGRKEVMRILKYLNKEEHMTIVLITHHMEETIDCDRIFVIDRGEIALSGTPTEVFSDVEKMKKLSLDVPKVTELSYELSKEGYLNNNRVILRKDEFINEFRTQYKVDQQSVEETKTEASKSSENKSEENKIEENKIEENKIEENITEENKTKETKVETTVEQSDKEAILEIKKVNYYYEKGNRMQVHSVKDVSLEVYKNEFLGIMGHTGSGKSTLIQIMNGLLTPESGVVVYKGKDINAKGCNKKDIHCNIGLVFQYPESQLFGENVLEDVMFGPLNKGMSKEEASSTAKKALTFLSMDEKFYTISPFELSGGEKRRVAIAGVLAMDPEIIILDEPTAGLDPKTSRKLLEDLVMLQQKMQKTIIIVSHNMDDLATYVDRIVVMYQGEKKYDDTPKEVFSHTKELKKMGLASPVIMQVMQELNNLGYKLDPQALTVGEATRGIKNA